MDAALRQLVRQRAGHRCEYCHLSQHHISPVALQVDHIIARSHRGADAPENLALTCVHCNLHKGPNLSGYDPDRADIVRLFHPRRDRWEEHFRYEGPMLCGLTAIGRTTIWVLQINDEVRARFRREILESGGSFE
jgi:hypothetical protein